MGLPPTTSCMIWSSVSSGRSSKVAIGPASGGGAVSFLYPSVEIPPALQASPHRTKSPPPYLMIASRCLSFERRFGTTSTRRHGGGREGRGWRFGRQERGAGIKGLARVEF